MKRIVGKRPSEESPKALKVVVYRRWLWQRDEFYYEGDIGVSITAGVLMITLPDEILSYNAKHWRRVISQQVDIRAVK